MATAGGGDNPILEVERRAEGALAYGGIAALLGVAGVALAVAPAQVVEFAWAATPTALVAGLARRFGASLILAAIVASCLKDAAEKGHMKSDTYRRLNLAMAWWGLATAAALWNAPQQPLRLVLGLCVAVLGGGAAHSVLTYREHGGDLSPLYLLRQFLSSLGNLSSYSNTDKTAIIPLYGYGLAAKAALAAGIVSLTQGTLKVAKDGLLLAPLGTLGQAMLPLQGLSFLLAATVLFTLKDAAARGRLGASTFKALNAGIAVLALTMATETARWIQAGILAKGWAAYSRVGVAAALGALALYQFKFAKK